MLEADPLEDESESLCCGTLLTWAWRRDCRIMNTDIDESDSIMVDPGGDVRKRGAGLPVSPDPAGAAASTKVGKAPVIQ